MKNSLASKSIFMLLLLSGLSFSACMPDVDCKECQVVTYDLSTGQEINRESAIEYCGSSLDEKESSDPVIYGNEKIVWECY